MRCKMVNVAAISVTTAGVGKVVAAVQAVTVNSVTAITAKKVGCPKVAHFSR